jgi:hypothetical protein
MRRLMTGYAVTFNLRHHRSGHAFQNRYKSIVCEEEECLLALVRCIGLHPLRARLVDNLDQLDRYPWSSHAVLMGHQPMEGQAVDEVLARFAPRRAKAVRHYRGFMEAGVALGKQEELVGGGLRRSLHVREDEAGAPRHRQAYDERVLGSGEFVEALWKTGALGEDTLPKLSLEVLEERVAGAYAVDATAIRRRRRLQHLSDARAAVCYLAVRHLGYKGVEVGRRLGLGRAGASAAAKRGQAVVERNPKLLEVLAPQLRFVSLATCRCSSGFSTSGQAAP